MTTTIAPSRGRAEDIGSSDLQAEQRDRPAQHFLIAKLVPGVNCGARRSVQRHADQQPDDRRRDRHRPPEGSQGCARGQRFEIVRRDGHRPGEHKS